MSPGPYGVDVAKLDVDKDPERHVDVALFDTYRQAGLGLRRVRSLARSDTVGAVAVYTWSLNAASRTAVYDAGAEV